MAMFPIFIIGLISGIMLSAVYNMYKKETPSETQLNMLTRELEQEKNDKEMLEKLTDKLYKQIEDLKDELTLEKNIKE